MKKHLSLAILSFFALFVFILILHAPQKELFFSPNGEDAPIIYLKAGLKKYPILPWVEPTSDVVFYFIPSYVEDLTIYFEDMPDSCATVNGELCHCFTPNDLNELYTVDCNGKCFSMKFFHNSNLSSVFITTKSNTMDLVNSDKSISESGSLTSLGPNGKIEYDGIINKISGHGNGTWYLCDKKPYNIELKDSGTICGIPQLKNFKLLALYYDGDKIHSKLAFDIANAFEAEYVVESNWVNLYLNGTYQGLYLLTESVSKLSDFSTNNTFLVERDIEERCNPTTSVSLDSGNFFTVSKARCSNAYIKSFLQDKENSIYDNRFSSELDVKSFAIQYLIEEMTLNYDAFATSSYFYKKNDSDLLFAGPAWDYDGAFGEYLHQGEALVNPNSTVIGINDYQLDWFSVLYDTDSFQSVIQSTLAKASPNLNTIFTSQIDEYTSIIHDSVEADNARWHWTDGSLFRAGTYMTWENDVRYLKYFGTTRLNQLCTRFSVDYKSEASITDNSTHTVSIVSGDNFVMEIIVNDGDTIDLSNYPELSPYNQFCYSYSGEIFNKYLPILEDCSLIAN